jgi:xanthine dehydrogenase YagS FAD-binding subunit
LLGADDTPVAGGDGWLRPLRGVQPLAGGTDLLTLIKADVAAPSLLVNVKRAGGLGGGIRETPGGLTLGALDTLPEIGTSPLITERFPLLSEAAALAATPQLRNMATIGGNVLQRPRCWYFRNRLFHCWLKGGDECQARDGENQFHAIFEESPCVAVHPSDLATALLAIGAEVSLRGPRGERTIGIGEFFAPPDERRRTETTLHDDELVLALHLPALPGGARSAYRKAMDRKVWAFALAGVAAIVRQEGGRIAEARLALGGVGNIPRRVPAAEQALTGAAPSEDVFGRAAEAALAGARPLAHNGYKLPLLRGLIRQALRAACL